MFIFASSFGNSAFVIIFTRLKSATSYVRRFFPKPPKNRDTTNRNNSRSIDDLWFMDFLDSHNEGPKIANSFRFSLVVVDLHIQKWWLLALKKQLNKWKIFSKNLPFSSKRNPVSQETQYRKNYSIRRKEWKRNEIIDFSKRKASTR